MILILSNSRFESSTDSVCDWLIHLNADFFRLNIDELFSDKYKIYFDIDNDFITITNTQLNKEINLNDIKIVWCRRKSEKSFNTIIDNISDDNITYNRIVFARFMSMERNTFLKTILKRIEKGKWFDYYETINELNKIEALQLAKKVGLNIPKSFITNYSESFSQYNHINEESITKPLFEATGFIGEKGSYITHTKQLDKRNKIPSYFTPSLIQAKINKKYELRIFYLDNQFFAMAIFSSSNSKTKLDFRAYDFKKPNRTVPYNLPDNIKNSLNELMNKLNLYNGSIDMIVDTDGNYIFLEVNPIGQFGMVSLPCRYYIEKEIAMFLINRSK
ncbi:ATP-GRASP peptide maturase, grasp-with-spasm system [Chryseobacterium soldanellicola]|uniref:ATP-GRASP peptide maturase, grasp-with-spasm system n=1 Tax=Chryseobacterium soldanellicola TaxID=311333 RepID=A0A1H0ZQR6_9FLAO|nr:grasp-with-spasm system ATP-grasp peptide maturase [Chryseobacterium soldanellicola]SDQ29376.1 ATP-GRASP peptide maturase, grasp-with-spasm system [Chryseobacterium soldanellicola]